MQIVLASYGVFAFLAGQRRSFCRFRCGTSHGIAMASIKRFEASSFDAPEWPFTASDMSRLDESMDFNFYSTPRFVTHIDDGAIAALTQYYRETLPPGSDLLDICSSWVSHLPEEVSFGRVVGLGMNARELEANTALTEWVAADLNVKPNLPFESESFDVVLNVVSVDYLNKPREVFEEMHRVLRPGGQAMMSFSNRCFPTKAIKMWLNADDSGRQKIVASYFNYAPQGGWRDIAAVDISPSADRPVGFDLRSIFSSILSPGDPMFVVRAVKV